jgi:hypothetical protein
MPISNHQLCASAAIAVGLMVASGPVSAQAPVWSQYEGLTAIEIPFANGPISAAHVPEIFLKLHGGTPRRFGLDTGSTGIAVAAEHFTPVPGDVAGGPGQIVYNSSGRILSGTYYTTDVEILRDAHTPVATARVQVLRVENITCQLHARDCAPNPNPTGVSFMGIGFDRDAAQRSTSSSPRNPFVNLTALASGASVSSVRPGYVITRSGVHLGMTPELTRDFAFVKLTRKTDTTWNAAPLTVSVDGNSGSGTGLVDTGINYMFLSPPPGTALVRGARAPAGTRIEIYLPDKRNPQPASYGFTVGEDRNPLRPPRIEVVHDAGVFVNTGRMFFEGFNYLYDAAGGYVGYAWNGRLGSDFGAVTPGLSKGNAR